jgi:hypothetical protein
VGKRQFFLSTLAKLQKATISFVMSVRLSAWTNSAAIGRILTKFDICLFSRKSVEKIKVYYNLTTVTSTLHENKYPFFIIFPSAILKMRQISRKFCRENQTYV